MGFATEYLCTFAPSPHEEHAFKAWLDYYESCEAFDRRVCSGVSPRGGCIPAAAWESAAVNRHAAERMRDLRAQTGDIDAATMRRAQDAAFREHERRRVSR